MLLLAPVSVSYVKTIPFCIQQKPLSCPQFSGWTVFLKGNWDTATFLTNYLPFILFPVLYIGSRVAYKVRPVKPVDMDFVTNIAEIERDT